MLSKSKFYHFLRIRLAFVVIVVTLAVVNNQDLVYAFKHNLSAIYLLQSDTAILSDAPWANHSWWNTTCRDENGYLGSDLLNRLDKKADFTYLQAIIAIMQGDCLDTARTLKTIIYHQPSAYLEKTLLAYVYSMTGEWIESATLFPVSDIPEGNWALRRYWGNVLLRAGLTSGSEAFLQESESLLGIYRPDADENLYNFWVNNHNMAAAFEELRWFITESDESRSNEFLEDYRFFAEKYVTLKVAAHPESEKWQLLSEQISATKPATSLYQPNHIFNYQWDEQWILWGITIDEAELSIGPFMTVTFYWLPVNTLSHEDLIIEQSIVQNYIPDAGFEWGMPVSGVRPFGYNALYNNRYPYPYEIVQEKGEQYFCLFNDQELQNTGVQSRWFPSPISVDRLVVGGDYQTEQGGKATLGFRWRGDDGDIENRHVVAGDSFSQWQSGVEVIEIPYQAKEIAFQILQFQSTGIACFDNLFMFTLDGPTNEIK